MSRSPIARAASAPPRRSEVVHLPLPGTDAALVAALRAGRREAAEALFDRYAAHVQRVLLRVLGPDQELHDLVQDVFVAAFEGIEKLAQPSTLKPWLSQIAVFTARGRIRRRVRWRFFTFRPGHELDEFHAPRADHEATEALRATYRILDRMPADERCAFALRFIERMELSEVAHACSISVATVKRRLNRAQRRFRELAAGEPCLAEWLGGAP